MEEMANVVRRKKAFENKWELYEKISANPGSSIYDLSKKMDWTPGKVEHYFKKLIKDGMIENSTEIVNGRNRKSIRAKDIEHFINWDEIKELKKPSNENET